MRRSSLLLATTISLVVSFGPAQADYRAAEAALESGDFATAIPLLDQEAKLGNPVAAYNLGRLYEQGSAGAPDFQQAAAYYRIAAELDLAPKFDGTALGPQAAQLIQASQMYAQYSLGRLYETGQGVQQAALAGTVGSDHGKHLTRLGRESRLHPAGHAQVGDEGRAHGVPSQWSRSATSTPIETTSMTRLSESAASWSACRVT